VDSSGTPVMMRIVPTREAPPLEWLRPGRYRHFKGHEYELLSVARHTETDEWYAVYRSVSDPDRVWVRPAEMFTEPVDAPGGVRRRFEPSEPAPLSPAARVKAAFASLYRRLDSRSVGSQGELLD
jgi:hypothetical protein